jgi:hypothetical protein
MRDWSNVGALAEDILTSLILLTSNEGPLQRPQYAAAGRPDPQLGNDSEVVLARLAALTAGRAHHPRRSPERRRRAAITCHRRIYPYHCEMAICDTLHIPRPAETKFSYKSPTQRRLASKAVNQSVCHDRRPVKTFREAPREDANPII